MSSVTTSIKKFDDPRFAPDLAEAITDKERQMPIVALTARLGGVKSAICPESLSTRLGNEVEVWCLDSKHLTLALQNELEASPLIAAGSSSPYNGAVMVWWPLEDGGEQPIKSKLILDRTGEYGETIVDEVVEHLASGPSFASRPHRPLTDTSLESERERRKQAECLERSLLAENRELTQQLKVVRREHAKLKKAQARKRTQSVQPPQEIATESEIAGCWAENYMESGRSLPAFSVGEDFDGTLQECDVVSRSKVVAIAARLIGGMTTSLEVHALRTGRGGNDPQRIRVRDDAKAFRCAVKRNSPGAARLHYWRLPDGRIELSSVAHHDTERIAK